MAAIMLSLLAVCSSTPLLLKSLHVLCHAHAPY